MRHEQEEDRAEIWEMATQMYGEPELQALKDVHWKALTVLDKLHKRDKRAREKSIAEYARDASKGAAGLLHRLTKPRPVWCPRDAAQGEASNPRDSAELAAKSWSRIWRIHVEELQTADRPWETPRRRRHVGVASARSRWSIWLQRSGRIFQGKDGALVSTQSIPPCHVVAHLRKMTNNCTPTF